MTRCPNCHAHVGTVYEETPTSNGTTVQSVCMAWCGWSEAKRPMTPDESAAMDRQNEKEAVNAERGRQARKRKRATSGWDEELLKRARR